MFDQKTNTFTPYTHSNLIMGRKANQSQLLEGSFQHKNRTLRNKNKDGGTSLMDQYEQMTQNYRSASTLSKRRKTIKIVKKKESLPEGLNTTFEVATMSQTFDHSQSPVHGRSTFQKISSKQDL